jgi:hypothetical protein
MARLAAGLEPVAIDPYETGVMNSSLEAGAAYRGGTK